MIVKALFFSFLFQKIKRDSSTPFSRLVWVSIWSFIIHKEIVSGFICNPIFLRLEFVCEDKVRSQINPHRGCYNHEVKHNASLWNDHSSNIFCSVSTWWKHPAFIRSGTICCTNYSWSALIKKKCGPLWRENANFETSSRYRCKRRFTLRFENVLWHYPAPSFHSTSGKKIRNWNDFSEGLSGILTKKGPSHEWPLKWIVLARNIYYASNTSCDKKESAKEGKFNPVMFCLNGLRSS